MSKFACRHLRSRRMIHLAQRERWAIDDGGANLNPYPASSTVVSMPLSQSAPGSGPLPA